MAIGSAQGPPFDPMAIGSAQGVIKVFSSAFLLSAEPFTRVREMSNKLSTRSTWVVIRDKDGVGVGKKVFPVILVT
jgi:hypothetical protein